MADSLFVIDSTFLLETSRNSFHGVPLLQDSSGRDTTMLFGFARDLLRLRKQFGMRKALVVIGDDGPCLPDSLISGAIDFLRRLRVPVIYAKGVRVGDVCAVLSERCTWIVTGNKAMLQLVSDRCGVILPKKGNELDVVTVACIKDHLGVGPSQVASLFALTQKNGCDSILTQRQAVRFLELHGTLETVLKKAAADDLEQVARKLVMRSDALSERCRELQFTAASFGDVKSGYAETNFIEEAEAAASALKEYRFWSLVRLLPFPERELVRAEENLELGKVIFSWLIAIAMTFIAIVLYRHSIRRLRSLPMAWSVVEIILAGFLLFCAGFVGLCSCTRRTARISSGPGIALGMTIIAIVWFRSSSRRLRSLRELRLHESRSEMGKR
jgi:hypothetical protein